MRSRHWICWLVFFVAGAGACPPPAETGATDDTDVEVDCGELTELTGNVVAAAQVRAPGQAVTVALLPMQVGSELVLQDPWMHAVGGVPLEAGAEVPWMLCLPAQADEAMYYTPEPEDWPTFTMASFLIGAWVDSDEDGLVDDDEILVGASGELLIDARGDLPDFVTDKGGTVGWNLVKLSFDDGPDPVKSARPLPPEGLTDFALAANLLPTARTSLSAIMVPNLGKTVQVDLYNTAIFSGGNPPSKPTFASMAVDATATNKAFEFAGVFDATPEWDHLDKNGPLASVGIRMATYTAIAYDDRDGSGTWQFGAERPSAMAHVGREPAMLFYMETGSLLTGLYLETIDLQIGWSLVKVSGQDTPPTTIPWTTGLALQPPT